MQITKKRYNELLNIESHFNYLKAKLEGSNIVGQKDMDELVCILIAFIPKPKKKKIIVKPKI